MIIPDQKQSKTKARKKEEIPENKFVDKLVKALNAKEVELDDGTIVSNMDAIIQNLIDKAIDGDKETVKLIRDLLNGR